ncbi:peptidylprolyl isomerase [Neptunomonas sp. XY-337]|uniref:FKBP-type peptidyl-prolyl cis-trans isomerase n=1 Tax=Neptunomonas sp. XY-337 TaxID=2561897 RepID=UPI0010AA94B9|nr:peptidylprolyl isomerase [Neptunomonas sp. XY-337]
MTDIVVGPEKKVTLHFAIRLKSGDVVDDNFAGDPASFVIGDGNMLAGFEAALFGMKAGERKTHEILPENGFGMPNPSNMQVMERSAFEGMELEPGLVVSFQDPTGELPGVIRSFDDNKVEVDFNHPLAGQTLEFDVEILSVGE